jgi:hypothetical protein
MKAKADGERLLLMSRLISQIHAQMFISLPLIIWGPYQRLRNLVITVQTYHIHVHESSYLTRPSRDANS